MLFFALPNHLLKTVLASPGSLAIVIKDAQGFVLNLLQEELTWTLKNYVGRESPLYHAERLSAYYAK